MAKELIVRGVTIHGDCHRIPNCTKQIYIPHLYTYVHMPTHTAAESVKQPKKTISNVTVRLGTPAPGSTYTCTTGFVSQSVEVVQSVKDVPLPLPLPQLLHT